MRVLPSIVPFLCIAVVAAGAWAGDAVDQAAPAEDMRRSATPSVGSSLDRYREVLERPLFSPTRRPPVQLLETAPERADEIPVLHGVVLTSARRIALISAGTPPRPHRVSEGQDVGRWRIEAIGGDRITIRSTDGAVRVVRLERGLPSEKSCANSPECDSALRPAGRGHRPVD